MIMILSKFKSFFSNLTTNIKESLLIAKEYVEIYSEISYSAIKSFFKKVKTTLHNLYNKVNEIQKFELKKIMLSILWYGASINFMLSSLLGFKFSIMTVLGYGIFFWYLKEEMPDVVKKYRIKIKR